MKNIIILLFLILNFQQLFSLTDEIKKNFEKSASVHSFYLSADFGYYTYKEFEVYTQIFDGFYSHEKFYIDFLSIDKNISINYTEYEFYLRTNISFGLGVKYYFDIGEKEIIATGFTYRFYLNYSKQESHYEYDDGINFNSSQGISYSISWDHFLTDNLALSLKDELSKIIDYSSFNNKIWFGLKFYIPLELKIFQ